MELFDVEPSRSRWPDWELVADEIDATLRGTLPLDDRLAQQAHAYAGERRPSSPHPVTPEVTVVADASETSTVIEVRALDAIGLLYRLTAAFFALDLDVVAARVSTGTNEIIDAFYVRDRATGAKVTDRQRISQIEQRARAAVTADDADR